MNDAELINRLGGPTRVAELLAFEKHGAQRVQNWLHRGIPAQVKLDYPHIFLLDLFKQKRPAAPASTAQAATN